MLLAEDLVIGHELQVHIRQDSLSKYTCIGQPVNLLLVTLHMYELRAFGTFGQDVC